MFVQEQIENRQLLVDCEMLPISGRAAVDISTVLWSVNTYVLKVPVLSTVAKNTMKSK